MRQIPPGGQLYTASPFTIFGMPALGLAISGTRAYLCRRWSCGNICSGPAEQFRPNALTPMPSITESAATTSVPERILPALIAGKGHKDGLLLHAADRQNRRTRIGQRHHRLNDVEVDARLLKARHLLGVNVDELFKRRVAEGGLKSGPWARYRPRPMLFRPPPASRAARALCSSPPYG